MWCKHIFVHHNYLDEGWIPRDVIVGLFEMCETVDNTMVLQLQALLEKIKWIHSVIAFKKDEGKNLRSMVTTLWFIIDYESLKLLQVYEGTYFGHGMFKVG